MAIITVSEEKAVAALVDAGFATEDVVALLREVDTEARAVVVSGRRDARFTDIFVSPYWTFTVFAYALLLLVLLVP